MGHLPTAVTIRQHPINAFQNTLRGRRFTLPNLAGDARVAFRRERP